MTFENLLKLAVVAFIFWLFVLRAESAVMHAGFNPAGLNPADVDKKL